MCGIFAYMGHKPIPILTVLKVLRILENEQEPNEKSPVGGHGAGITYLNQRNKFTVAKTGKTNGSPAADLKRKIEHNTESSILILAHVRHASPEFKNTIKYRECTQPYKSLCTHGFNLASAHNGKIQNYKELKNKLTMHHKFESQKIELIDSEIIPHLFEELLLSQHKNPTTATHTLFEQIAGTNEQGNTIAILSKNKNQTSLNAIQKGRTRGLTLWTNPNSEVLLCSREKPVKKLLNKFLQENNYQKIIHIPRNQPANLETHYTLTPPNTHESH